MSGFFKKLFNRITGKKEEAAPAVEVEKVLPAPEPAPLPEPEPEQVAVEAPAPVVIEAPKPVKPTRTRIEPAKPEPKKPETKKPEPKPKAKPEAKKPKVKKPEPKKPEPKKVEVKKAEPKKPEVKKVESKPKPQPKPKTIGAVARKIIAPPPPEPEAIVVGQPVVELESVKIVVPAPESAPVPVERAGWLARLKDGLAKSSKTITSSITSIFAKRKLDGGTLQELEDVLIQADLGLAVSERIIKAVSAGRYDKEIEPEEVKRILAEEVAKVLKPVEVSFNFGSEKPFVILVVGVNGSGKTTTIGKLGAIAAREGFKVMFAACDTFRAAAIEQLTIWGQRVGARTISRPTGSDSSGLAFDAMTEARESGTDILFVDTAGRLQNKAYLMDELDKVVRVIRKQDTSAPHAVLLVLDATTGQNAISQAEVFTKVAGVTGLIMTKLDGTARGGILVAIAEKFKLPVHAIGVGEQIDDLQPFEAEAFARAIAGLEEP